MFWQCVVLGTSYGIPWCGSALADNGIHLGTAEKEIHFMMICAFSSSPNDLSHNINL